MPSFDVVSKLNLAEVTNAVTQAKKEIEQRYDFKGTDTTLDLAGEAIVIATNNDAKIEAVHEVLRGKLIKRGVPIENLDYGKVQPASGRTVRQEIKLVQGVDKEKAKDIVKAVKDSKLKVQAAIQDDLVRVTGKNRDDLQECIAMLRGRDFGIALQFGNFRE